MSAAPSSPSRYPRRLAVLALLALPLLATACSGPSTAATPSPSATATTAPDGGVDTVRTLIDAPREQPTLTLGGPAEPLSGETATAVSYESGGLTVTGVLRMPDGDGPFPAVTVVHGSVDPDRYESGRDMAPEQRALLDSGYAVLAIDMRGYAGSDPARTDGTLTIDPGFGWMTVLDWGMALDIVNALLALRSGDVDNIDPDRVGLLGHSLGGLLSLDAAVIAPEAADLVVALAAPSSDLAGAVTSAIEPGSEGWQLLESTVGTPDDNPDYWRDISPASFFDRAEAPLLLIHGTEDDVAPSAWAQQTADAWTAAGGQAEAVILDGADHHLEPRRDEAAGIMVAAFDAVLG